MAPRQKKSSLPVRITRHNAAFMEEAALLQAMEMEESLAMANEPHDSEEGMEEASIMEVDAHIPNTAEAVAYELDEDFSARYVEQNLLAERSTKLYRQQLSMFRKWIATLPSDCKFKDGLDILGEHSEQLCCHWLLEMLKERSKSFRTIEAMKCALGWHFQVTHNCTNRTNMTWRKDGEAWIGNPIYSDRFLRLYASTKRQDGRSGRRSKTAIPMLYTHLSVILGHIQDRLKGFERTPHITSPERTQLEFMHFFMILAYRLWARCDEVCSMQWSQINNEIQYSQKGNHPYLEVTITFRKTNQTNANNHHVHKLYHLKGRPLVDAASAYLQWKAYWTLVSGQAPTPNDLIFPCIARDKVHLEHGITMKATQINLLLANMEAINSILPTAQGHFTSHSFRRGGAQDAVMHAHLYNESRISVSHALWWGGWAQTEKVTTLAHYLFEEVAAQEQDHGDMEHPEGDFNRANYFAGAQIPTKERLLEGIQYEISQ